MMVTFLLSTGNDALAGCILGYAAGGLIAGILPGKRSSLPQADDHRPEIPDPLSCKDTPSDLPTDPREE